MVALREPATVGLATRIAAIPMKRTDTKVRNYVTREEMDAVLASLDRTHWCGRRDYALLLTMYNAGARVSEIASLRQQHVTFGPTRYVQWHGKGRKERCRRAGRRHGVSECPSRPVDVVCDPSSTAQSRTSGLDALPQPQE